MKTSTLTLLLLLPFAVKAQQTVNLTRFNSKGAVKATAKGNTLNVSWPVSKTEKGQVVLDLKNGNPLFKSLQLSDKKILMEVGANLDPAFILTVGKRDLISQNGWNIFFDKVPKKPHQSYPVKLEKGSASVTTNGSRTIIKIGSVQAASFKGDLEITLYNGSPLINIAAVMATEIDSTAIVYDAGLVSQSPAFKNIAWSNTDNTLQTAATAAQDSSRNLPVKYRTIIGEGKAGSVAVFPAPHQYFYPLDEAFNLKFVWYGNNYRGMIPGYGLGIRQELEGDKRFVPWFNAPPQTRQRLNFFVLLSGRSAASALQAVKKFTHNDVYPKIPGYKTMASHFHNEYVMGVIMKGKPVPAQPNFVKVFKATGVDVVHLAEFHYTAHPKGPDGNRLPELKALHDMCEQFSDKQFLLLPGEEPNEFLGGHWLSFFRNRFTGSCRARLMSPLLAKSLAMARYTALVIKKKC
jgi:hypothetical protein